MLCGLCSFSILKLGYRVRGLRRKAWICSAPCRWTAPAALMDCWTFMCTVCNVCRSDGGDQLVKVNRVEQTNKSVRLTEVVRALPVPTILHAPRVTAPLRDVWSARPGDGKDRMLHDEAFRSFSNMYVLGLCNRRRCLGVCWGRESSRELKVLALLAPLLYTLQVQLHLQHSVRLLYRR